MKYRYVALSLGLVFLMLFAPTFGLVAAQQPSLIGEQWFDWAPTKMFYAHWYGTLLQTEGSIEFWQILIESGMMMPGGTMPPMTMGEQWVEITLMWDTSTHKGQIIESYHSGMNLFFTGWGGSIENPIYHFWIGGHGVGQYNYSGIFYPADIWGGFEGIYTPDDPANPFVSGTSEFTERALVRYGMPPVGGEVIPVDKIAVSSPYLALLVLVAVLSVTVTFAAQRKLRY